MTPEKTVYLSMAIFWTIVAFVILTLILTKSLPSSGKIHIPKRFKVTTKKSK
jgi:hypothetical protein